MSLLNSNLLPRSFFLIFVIFFYFFNSIFCIFFKFKLKMSFKITLFFFLLALSGVWCQNAYLRCVQDKMNDRFPKYKSDVCYASFSGEVIFNSDFSNNIFNILTIFWLLFRLPKRIVSKNCDQKPMVLFIVSQAMSPGKTTSTM